MHVLTTPPAFRLSQDQTLQLFFLDRRDPPAHRVTLRRRAGLNGFSLRVILEEEFVHRPTSDEVDRLLLPHRRLRQQGQSKTLQPTRTSPVNQKAFDARLKTSSGRPRRESRAILTQINDFPTGKPAGGITYLRAPRRRFEIQTRLPPNVLFDDIRLCPIRRPPKRLTTGLTSSR